MASSAGTAAKDGAMYAHSAAVTWEQSEAKHDAATNSAASTPERLVGAGRSAPRSSLKRAPSHETGEAAGVATTAALPLGHDSAASKVFSQRVIGSFFPCFSYQTSACSRRITATSSM